MNKHLLLLGTICLSLSCGSSDRSLDQVIRDAEANAVKRQVGNIAAKCNDPSNTQETNDTFNAMKIAVEATDCTELADNLVGLQEISLRIPILET